MGTNTPNLSAQAIYSATVIRQRVEQLDRIRSGFIVVSREASSALQEEHGDLVDALMALAQAMEAPIKEISVEVDVLAPEGAE